MIDLRKKSLAASTADCPICIVRRQTNTTEVYLIGDGEDRYFFNVDKAKSIVSDGRPSIAIAESTVQRIAAVNDHAPIHLAHVRPDEPGIMLQRFGGLVLLDGIHRAVRSLQEARTFHVHMLNYAESLICLIRQEIASQDANSIVAKLRKVMGTAPTREPIEAEMECTLEVLAEVRRILSPEERRRFILTAVPPRRRGM